MYAITQFVIAKPAASPATQAVSNSPYTISIEQASWGANCQSPFSSSNNNDDNSYEKTNQLKSRENNVLYNVSQLCNAKSKCNIPINQNFLGQDPLPSCGYKTLLVEYRCFSVDRLRKLEEREGIMSIDCDKQFSSP
jgi:hypothetical protein